MASFYSLIAASRARGDMVKARYPMTMEEIGQNYGFLLYRTTCIANFKRGALLTINGLRDRAIVLVDRVGISEEIA